MSTIHKLILLLLVLLGGSALFLSGEGTRAPSSSSQASPANIATTSVASSTEGVISPTNLKGPYMVVRVVDGDTLTVSIDGEDQTIRLIGINTPETVDPRKPIECFGKEASAEAKALLGGRNVYLEADESQDTYDKYQRLLAYVYLEDGTNINKRMIENGFAYEYTYQTPYKYQAIFKATEASAKAGGKGLWATNACSSVSSSTPQSTSSFKTPVVPISLPASEYICTRNAYNCTDFKVHSEAQAVYESCGGVTNDIHKLDSDGDGLACETLP